MRIHMKLPVTIALRLTLFLAITLGFWNLCLAQILGPPQAEKGYTLAELTEMALAANPSLAGAQLSVDVARGQAIQAGLYPNPTITFSGEEIGPKGGIQTLPQVSQRIVTAGKLRLSRAAAERGVDQAQFNALAQKYTLFSTVRTGFYEVLGIQERLAMLAKQLKTASQSYEFAEKLFKGLQIAKLDLLQFEVEKRRIEATFQATQRQYRAAWRSMASDIGLPDLPPGILAASIYEPLPEYDFETAKATIRQVHPAIQAAYANIAKAELALRRAEVQRIPDITIAAGYSRNFNERADQGTYQLGIPLPIFNRNQGNVLSARAALNQAHYQLKQVENTLIGRLADAFGRYAAAKEQIVRYRDQIIPQAETAYKLSLTAFKGGQFEYLRVIQAQRAVIDSNLLYVRFLSDGWQAAAEISALLLEEEWPKRK